MRNENEATKSDSKETVRQCQCRSDLRSLKRA